MKSFKDRIKESLNENWSRETRGLWTSTSSGKTWSPATGAPPYRNMSGPINANDPVSEPGGDVMPIGLEQPLHLPFPLSTVTDQLAAAYLNLTQIQYNLKACLKQNATLQGKRQELLKKQIQQLEKLLTLSNNMREMIKEISKDIEKFSLNK